jgi:4-hydroxy-4-methyl-2-oxoglutarate aldolase
MSESLLERLGALDACAGSDALDRLQLPGAAAGIGRLTTGATICGQVTTVLLGPAEDSGTRFPRHLGTAAVEASGPGHVIVVDHQGRLDVAGWGGNLSLAAHRRGVRGVIVDGACRDIDESRSLGFPLFARGATTRTARGRVAEQGWNVPVTIGGVTVHPGDLVIGDGSGVVFIPSECAELVIAAAEEIAEKERGLAEQIRAGEPLSQVMGAGYETMLEERL